MFAPANKRKPGLRHRTIVRKLASIPVLGLLSCLAPAAAAIALQYDVKQVSDEAVISREPVIGDAALVAWISAYTNELAGGKTSLTVLDRDNGQRRDLSSPEGGRDNFKPVAQSNALVWVGSYTNARGSPTAGFAEVPWRDEGGATELRAIYSLAPAGSNGNIALVPVSTGIQFQAVLTTNQAGGPVVTNVADQVTVTNELRRPVGGDEEIIFWSATSSARRITHDVRNDISPSVWDGQVAWQKSKGWPFGWEIFYWKDGVQKQLTTNFYYDMAPRIQGRQVVWYGWDGHDFEIFLYDQEKDRISQVTSNRFDDVAPVIWNGDIAWEGYQSAEADIYMYHEAFNTNGQSIGRVANKISENVEDDISPRIWNGYVVWQGFDGDDFEIYLYDGKRTRKLTANNYDDTNPDIRDGVVVWQAYKDNWDAEIFAWEIPADANAAIDPKSIVQVTDNEEEDRDPRTAVRRIVWQQDAGGKSRVLLASPK